MDKIRRSPVEVGSLSTIVYEGFSTIPGGFLAGFLNHQLRMEGKDAHLVRTNKMNCKIKPAGLQASNLGIPTSKLTCPRENEPLKKKHTLPSTLFQVTTLSFQWEACWCEFILYFP